MNNIIAMKYPRALSKTGAIRMLSSGGSASMRSTALAFRPVIQLGTRQMMIKSPFTMGRRYSSASPMAQPSYLTTEIEPQEEAALRLSINADYIARKLKHVEFFVSHFGSKGYATSVEQDSIIVRISTSKPSTTGGMAKTLPDPSLPLIGSIELTAAEGPQEGDAPITQSSWIGRRSREARTLNKYPFARDQFIVIFDYGALVFVNCDQDLRQATLAAAKKFSKDHIESSVVPPSESFNILVQPDLDCHSKLVQDCVILRTLDVPSLRMITNLLGQSIAVNAYESLVEEALRRFRKMNSNIELNGKIDKMEKDQLIQFIAWNNSIVLDLSLSLKISNWSRPGDISWKDPDIYAMWEELYAEFELTHRQQGLEDKLDLIQSNTRFFLDWKASAKSEKLEWIIIGMIGLEGVIAVYHDTIRAVLDAPFAALV